MEVLGNTIFVGCDPEVFVINKKTKEPVPAYGLIPGTKENPLKVPDGMVQVDGLALEFGIDPAKSENEFFGRIQSVLKTLQSMLPNELELSFVPVITFNMEDINKLPDEALELGCDPDYCAYTLEPNPRPTLPNPGMRSAGGHVHCGWGFDFPALYPEHIKACAALTAEMDYRLGIPSMSWDSNALRRQIYGQAGAFRPKSYGMEYRTLSNQWLKSEKLIRFVYRQTIKAVEATILGKNNYNNRVDLYQNTFNFLPREVINQNFSLIGEILFKDFESV